MSHSSSPLLPTSVIGSYALPGWMWTAVGEIDGGNYGETDIRETLDDAVTLAVLDQERAGVDIITDGEMRRWYFVQGFYKRMIGIVADPPLRKVGLYGYDSPPAITPRRRSPSPRDWALWMSSGMPGLVPRGP